MMGQVFMHLVLCSQIITNSNLSFIFIRSGRLTKVPQMLDKSDLSMR